MFEVEVFWAVMAGPQQLKQCTSRSQLGDASRADARYGQAHGIPL